MTTTPDRDGSAPSDAPAASVGTESMIAEPSAQTGTLTMAQTLSPVRRRTLMGSLLVGNLMLFATYAGVIAILLPQQVADLTPANKIGNFAIVTAISSIVTIFVQPIVGALSDRTRSRLGRRSPWIVFGGIGGGLCVIALQFSPGIFVLTVIWVLAQVLLNAWQGPMSSIIADRIAPSGRATSSAFAGVGTSIGAAVGVILAGQLLVHLGLAYLIFGIGVIVVSVLFVVINPDQSSKEMERARFSWLAFAKSFWVSPRKHPDYAWAFGGRFFMVLGYQAIAAYQLYILEDYIHLTPLQAGSTAGLLSVVSMICMIVSTLVFGRISDKTGRRKMFVFVATIVIAVGVLAPVFSPTVGAMFVYTAIVGIGYGAYMAVDLALMIDVLPSQGDVGKDLGVLNIAANVPQALTPVIAALLLGLFAGNYVSIFIYAIVAIVLSSVLVFPIKSVR
ncbi:MFS transporter [Humibacter sp. RRB41]|uniref:MFS transporter n=1 Tax=Humibacter sp. RRB41 TaxID=2919946 RepID=UPI001FAA56D7|nr:MFS transporter [Humibacter sp. RRB41]